VHPELPPWAQPILTRPESYDVLAADIAIVERAVEARLAAERVA
jgi:hypothetical protein